MPHKFTAAHRDQIPKQKHRVTNWAAYNEGLRRRGDLTVWINDDVLGLWSAPRRTTRGGQRQYSDLAIELCLTLGMVFNQPPGQTQGLMRSIARLSGIEIAVPDFSKLEKSHKAEKRDLGDMQKLAEREEIRSIKAEIADKRRDARENHTANMSAVKTHHADELTKAVKALENARQITEREGRDLSQGRNEKRKTAHGFGFSKQGFNQRGLGFGRDADRERDDQEREREIKPLGQDLTPK